MYVYIYIYIHIHICSMNMYIWFKVPPPLLVIPSPAENRPRGTPGLADYEQRGGTEGRLDTAEGRCG